MSAQFGTVTQVIGPVIDVSFEGGKDNIPPIYSALKVERENGEILILEVEQHIGEDTVRCVAMESTDGIRRGVKVENLGHPSAYRRPGEGTFAQCYRRTYRPSA